MNNAILLLLDFDGTLVPITRFPQTVELPLTTKNLLQKLSRKKGIYLAISSGRKLTDIKARIDLPDIIYGGNHGLEGEIFGEKYSFPIPDKILRNLRTIKEQLDKIAAKFNGVLVEDKELTLSFHYRSVNKQQIPEIKLLFNLILKPYIAGKSIFVRTGKEVFDIMPNLNWNKGNFADLIVKKINMLTNKRPTVIAVGDDLTDENVFQKLKNCISITIGKKKNSSAGYYLNNSEDLIHFLDLFNNLV